MDIKSIVPKMCSLYNHLKQLHITKLHEILESGCY